MVLEALSRKASLEDITQDQVVKYRFLMLHQFHAGKMLRERSPGGKPFYPNLIHLYGRQFVSETGGMKEATTAIGMNYRVIRAMALGDLWRKKGGVHLRPPCYIEEDLTDLLGPQQLIRFEEYKDHAWGLLYAVLGTYRLLSPTSGLLAADEYFDETKSAAYRRPWAYHKFVDSKLMLGLKKKLEGNKHSRRATWDNFEKREAPP